MTGGTWNASPMGCYDMTGGCTFFTCGECGARLESYNGIAEFRLAVPDGWKMTYERVGYCPRCGRKVS